MIPKNIEQKVLNGLVLDEHGKWIPISEKIKKERIILEQIEAGNVIVDGKWVPIRDALNIYSKKNEDVQVDIEPSLENNIPFPPETVLVEFINDENLPETVVLSIEENENNKNEKTEMDSLSQIADSVTVNDTGIDLSNTNHKK